ncbi:YegP family protein [Cellulomonas rhizosphaerae]|uniref:DUF1508 domain-containing protein n=1 Tax=Cellulomonas rhizosphaerae TaxID=2293719 RepID=A0A413RJL7_9CELL|nr:DUF1508 domain-containing protein [Cellulomonas rhizosphaerae]RHA38728.1 DUF1508 domain-containing protein [Cellulomonas rhizosphaerae]
MADQSETKFEVYERTDGRWAWRLRAGNNLIIATDGGQGYENRETCESLGWGVVSGYFKPSER